MLNSIFIDYNFLLTYDEEELKKCNVLPLSSDGMYKHFAICKESDLSFFDKEVLVKRIDSTKEEILFYLGDLKRRKSIYQLYLLSLNSQEFNSNILYSFLEELLEFALYKRSSDIHIETTKKALSIRFRIDGNLKQFFLFDIKLYALLSSVLKLKASLDITEKRRPLDGRFCFELLSESVDFRFSSMPTIHGESIVLRVLKQEMNNSSLGHLGFNLSELNKINRSLKNSNGLVLVTGPTGSGKTTTLYAMLKALDSKTKKIITIEDPIEYELENIQQIAVNNELGLSFNAVLKNILRQDPDVIMIGEIRDKESLQIALQSSLTGHLVLSTLHTNSSVDTLGRLFDLEAQPYILASTLKTIIAQRLVLKSCECKEGCSLCNYTLYNGRTTIHEILEVNSTLSSMISQRTPAKEVLDTMKNLGFVSLFENANKKVAQGITTQEEIFRVLGNGDETI